MRKRKEYKKMQEYIINNKRGKLQQKIPKYKPKL